VPLGRAEEGGVRVIKKLSCPFLRGKGSDALGGYHEEIRRRLPPSGRVLDLGCGDNRQLSAYRTPAREVWGVDVAIHPHVHHLHWFRQLGPEGTIPFPAASFDLVACSWVLEHVATPPSFLREVRRILRPGGWFISLTPNGQHYVTWVTRAFGLLPHAVTQNMVQRLYGRAHHDTFPTHFRLNTPLELDRAARRAGMPLRYLVGFANPDYFRFWTPLRRAAVLADQVLDRLNRGSGRLYLVASMRRPPESRDQPLAA
jgi:SAM-dependent methyltransferase